MNALFASALSFAAASLSSSEMSLILSVESDGDGRDEGGVDTGELGTEEVLLTLIEVP